MRPQVYKAVLDTVNHVAVKFLNPERANSTSAMKAFGVEIDILRACRNVHVVSFVGAWACQVIGAEKCKSKIITQ